MTVLVALFGKLALAQTVDLPTTRPLLDQLNRETQSLFKEVAPSIVRVQLPLPSNLVLPPDDPLSKWAGRLDPGVAAAACGVAARFVGGIVRDGGNPPSGGSRFLAGGTGTTFAHPRAAAGSAHAQRHRGGAGRSEPFADPAIC